MPFPTAHNTPYPEEVSIPADPWRLDALVHLAVVLGELRREHVPLRAEVARVLVTGAAYLVDVHFVFARKPSVTVSTNTAQRTVRCINTQTSRSLARTHRNGSRGRDQNVCP